MLLRGSSNSSNDNDHLGSLTTCIMMIGSMVINEIITVISAPPVQHLLHSALLAMIVKTTAEV